MNKTILQHIPLAKYAVIKMWEWDARLKMERIRPHIKHSDDILDIGSGLGTVAKEMRQNNFRVELVDIENHSIKKELAPTIYDGKRLPYEDRQFDVALLLTILHHTPDPVRILKEAQRVAAKIIVIEDIYRNNVQKRMTYWVDSLVNAEWKEHPHQNHSDTEWKHIFNELSLKLLDIHYQKWLLFFEQATYILESG